MSQESFCADDLPKKMIEKYSVMVYRLAYSLMKNGYDADDIHQDVFVRYIHKRPRFENTDHEKAWFIRVTVNCCRNYYKTAWRRKVVSLSEYDAVEKEVPAESGDLIGTVKKLSPKYRVVIHLFYYEELSIEEIAGMLGLNASTVRTRLTRARRKLRELLKEDI